MRSSEYARAAAIDVLSAQGVPGTDEWQRHGRAESLPRAWRVVLPDAAAKIERWMLELVRGEGGA
jgi:hypothetical protein